MFIPADKAEQRERALAVLAERALALACDLQEAALAATDSEEKVRLAVAFQKVSRAVRQALYLDARLDREAVRDARDIETRAAQREGLRHDHRKAHVRLAVERAILETFDETTAELLTYNLKERVDEAGFVPGFDDDAVDVIIARLCAEYEANVPRTYAPSEGAPPSVAAPALDFDAAPYQSSA